ncbi:MAG: efflux RND transporter periplasmic adaptor subunit [Rhodocyclaceae bacterium]|nr:MAG: efflux RND transporter periplasmic adaptor subunit [Rhodocyclaceae bacterium]
MNTTLIKRLALALLLVAVLGAALKFATRPKPLPVLVATVENGTVETSVANTRAGSVAACRRAKVAPPAAGRIASLPVKKGQRVKAGELLLELWNDDLVAREKLSREQLETAKSRVTEACQLAVAAQSEAKQARSLRDKGFVSEERVVRAEAQAKSSQATCESAKAGVKEADARIAAARADTSRTVLRAPFPGIVAEINGEVGEYLTPSPPGIPTLPAVDLIDDSCLYVTAPIDEVDAAKIKVGMAGRITLDAWRGKHFAGKVRRIAPYVLALEKQARTVEVEVAFEDPAAVQKEGQLLVGYSADIEVVVESRDQALRIPTAALMPGNKVLLLGSEGVLEERKVEPGLSNWEYTEIKAGLTKGEQIVTSLDREGVKAGIRAVAESKKP